MQLTSIEIDLSSLELLDFEHTPACEGETHNEGGYGHVATAPAAWIMSTPCCGPKLLVCEPRRLAIRASKELICGTHKKTMDVTKIVFFPID